MKRICATIASLWLAAAVGGCAATPAAREGAARDPRWLWPPPQRMEPLDGGLPVKGTSVLIPDAAGRRATAIARALSRYAGFYHRTTIPVKRIQGAPDTPYVLAIARPGDDAPSFEKLAALVDVRNIPPQLPDRRMWRRESYVLRVTPQGAAIAAPEVEGLLQGARTFMQLARAAAKTRRKEIPALSITDWPDMPMHAYLVIRPNWYVQKNRHKDIAAVAGELKYNTLMFALYWGITVFPLHPEIKCDVPAGALPAFADYARSMGLPTWPWIVSSPGGPKCVGPIAYYQDTDEFYQVKFEMMDYALEHLRPSLLHVCMSEQYLVKKKWNGTMRTKDGYFDNLARHANFCLRRGVTPSIWGDNFRIKANFTLPDHILKSDPDAVRRMPRETIIVPWLYDNVERYEFPWETLAREDFGFRVMNACAWRGTDGSYHAQHMTRYGKDLPLMWGVIAVVWAGHEEGLPAANRCAGPLWNSRIEIPPKELVDENARIMAAAPYDVESPDFSEPLGLEAMMWREPTRPIADYVRELGHTDVPVWEEAREFLVAFGAEGAAEILRAMASSPPIEPGKLYEGLSRPLRWKLEGVLSRICRDGRHGEARGTLDTNAVAVLMDDACPYVRDIAAELVASCAPRQGAVRIILDGLCKKETFLSCARAAGVARMAEAVDPLVAAASDSKADPAHRAAAARSLGYLKPWKHGRTLLSALEGARDPALQRELIRTLSLIGMRKAENTIARHLRGDNEKFVRIRAAIALVNLGSRRIDGVEPWLAEDDRALVEVACWALGRRYGDDALTRISRSIEKQPDEDLKQALRYQVETKLFLKW